jgi:quinol monooxygenase YgiN
MGPDFGGVGRRRHGSPARRQRGSRFREVAALEPARTLVRLSIQTRKVHGFVTEVCAVIAIFTPKPERLGEIEDLLARISPLVHEEAGCDFYALHQDVEGRLTFVEAWATRRLWIEHMQEPTVKEILAGVEGKLVKEVEVYGLYNLPTGLTVKGVLAAGVAA